MKSRSKKDAIIWVLVVALIFETALLVKFWPRKPRIIIKPAPVVVAKVALIIDDWGYNKANIDLLKDINIPLDISILPFLPYSKKIAQEAHLNNKEVMLHLPLEPHPQEGVRWEKRVILSTMRNEEIIKIIDEALKNIPFSTGVNNHMGSLATEQRKVMAVVFKELKKRRLFFVDSLVTENSVCQELAEEMQVKFGQRSVFLDNQNDADYIRAQFLTLIKKAKRNGSAIGIGHDHPLTLKVIKEVFPEAEKQGIKFVFASELVN